MAGRKPEFDIPPDGYETAPVAVADDAPPDGYEGPSIGYKGVGASGSWDQPQPAVVPQPVVPHIQMPQNPDAMSTYKEALTAYLVGNRDLAKAKAEAALSLDTGLTEAKNMLTRMRVNPLAGTNVPRPEYSPQKFTDYTVGQMAADTYNAIDQSPVVRTLGSGVAKIGRGFSRLPNFGANLFALPYNVIVTLTGNEDRVYRNPKIFEKESKWWDEKYKQLNEGYQRWGSKGEDFVSVTKRKDPGEIASYVAYKVLEEAPQQALLIESALAKLGSIGISYMGLIAGAEELAATPENVNPAAATINAIVNGTVEAALEQTPTLMGKWSKAIEEAVGKKGRGEVIKAVAKTIGSSIVQEGLVEEAPTELLQSASRVMTGVDPNAMQGVGGRMIEAATIGGAMGGGMTAPAAIGSGIQMGAGKLGPGDFPPDGFNENNTPQGPIPPSSIGQSVAQLDIKQNPNYSLGDESARLAGYSDSVVNVPGVLDLRRGADAPVVPADRVLPSAIPADAKIPAPVQSPGNYERVALPQSPAIPNLEQPAPAESQSALPQPPQLTQEQQPPVFDEVPPVAPNLEQEVTEGQSNALSAFNKIIFANKMTDAVFAELVDSIVPDPVAFKKGYGEAFQADKFAIRGATYPVRNHATIKALVRFAKGAHTGTGYHESMHVIFNNALTAGERQVLMDKFGTEEQAAEAFAQYETKRTGQENQSRIKVIFDKILELLGQLRSYMSGKGWKTAEDVFKSVEQGRTERLVAEGKGEPKFQAEPVSGYPEGWQTGPARAVFRGWQDQRPFGEPFALYNIIGEHPRQRSTVSAETLKELGIEVPKTPLFEGTETDEPLFQAEKIENNKAMLPNGGYVPLAKLSKLQRIYREWLTTDRGVGQAIDRANEERIGKIMETAFDAPITGKQLLKYFKENPSDDLRQAVFEALTGQRSIFELPADITGIVQNMREDVDALSRVIAQTAAPNDRLKAVIERNLGRYLGRHYKLFERKNWRPSNEVISRAKAKLREMHPNTIGKASSQELNGIIENIISKGDVTFHRGDRRIDIPQNHFVKRKDIPKEIRDLYGEITDPVWAYLKTMADQAMVAHNADFLSKIAGMEGVFKDKPDETHFKQIPDVARWGAVRGKFTTQEVNDFLIEAIDPVDSGLFRFIEKLIVNPFKWTKTVASLTSHPRNFIGNTMFSVLAGNTITNPANIPYYWKALRVIMGKEGKYRGTWKELVRARVADTQFWGSEMPKLMAEMISDPVSWPDNIMNTVKWPVEKLGELYNNEDLIYRVSAFLKYRDNGMTVNQAAQEVDKWFTNYARLPKAVKMARRIGVFGPFLSFKANTARILINAAKEAGEGMKKGNPAPALRLAFVVSFIPLLQMAMQKVFDIDDDEKKNLDKLQDMGPIYKRNSTPIYYRTAEGSIKAFDLGYIWPTGEFDKAARAALVGDAESFTDSIDLFQHPLFDAYSILFNNFNTRNRQNVANVNDPMPRRAADKMAELARMLYVPASSPVPSIRGLAKGRYEPGLLTGYQIKTLYDAYHGVEDRFGRTREVPEELRAFFTGIRTWEIRPDDTKKAFRMRKAGEFQEAKRELRRYMRMPGISQEEKERRMDDWKRRVAKIRSDVESSNSVKLK